MKLSRKISLIALIITVLHAVSLLFIKKGFFVYWFNHHRSDLADTFFTHYTFLGNGLFFAIVGMCAMLYRIKYGVLFAIAGVLQTFSVQILKHHVFENMRRPKSLLPAESLTFVPGVDVHSSYSFPSGHATTAVAMCVILIYMAGYNKRTAAILIPFTLLNCYSRIYLAHHFMEDIVAGIVLGFICGFLSIKVWENIPAKPWMQTQILPNTNLHFRL